MLYGTDFLGQRIKATPKGEAYCPICGGSLVAKCGYINVWHWSHEAAADCDSWAEGESDWPLRWKQQAHPSQCEVVIGGHRADIVGSAGVIIELQHSSISTKEICEREIFYGNMIWLFDIRECFKNIDFRKIEGYHSFRWKWPRKHIAFAEKPVYLDTGRGIFHLKKIDSDTPCGGWGYVLKNETFINTYIK